MAGLQFFSLPRGSVNDPRIPRVGRSLIILLDSSRSFGPEGISPQALIQISSCGLTPPCMSTLYEWIRAREKVRHALAKWGNRERSGHVGGCQNFGPFLGPLHIWCRNI